MISNKWAITHNATTRTTVIEFLSPDGTKVVTRATFDQDAIEEFRDAIIEAAGARSGHGPRR